MISLSILSIRYNINIIQMSQVTKSQKKRKLKKRSSLSTFNQEEEEEQPEIKSTKKLRKKSIVKKDSPQQQIVSDKQKKQKESPVKRRRSKRISKSNKKIKIVEAQQQKIQEKQEQVQKQEKVQKQQKIQQPQEQQRKYCDSEASSEQHDPKSLIPGLDNQKRQKKGKKKKQIRASNKFFKEQSFDPTENLDELGQPQIIQKIQIPLKQHQRQSNTKILQKALNIRKNRGIIVTQQSKIDLDKRCSKGIDEFIHNTTFQENDEIQLKLAVPRINLGKNNQTLDNTLFVKQMITKLKNTQDEESREKKPQQNNKKKEKLTRETYLKAIQNKIIQRKSKNISTEDVLNTFNTTSLDDLQIQKNKNVQDQSNSRYFIKQNLTQQVKPTQQSSIRPQRKFEQQKLKGSRIQSEQSKFKQQSHQAKSQNQRISLPIKLESNKMIIQKENPNKQTQKQTKKQPIITVQNNNHEQHKDGNSSNDDFSIKQIIQMNKNKNLKKKNMKINNKFKGLFEQEAEDSGSEFQGDKKARATNKQQDQEQSQSDQEGDIPDLINNNQLELNQSNERRAFLKLRQDQEKQEKKLVQNILMGNYRNKKQKIIDVEPEQSQISRREYMKKLLAERDQLEANNSNNNFSLKSGIRQKNFQQQQKQNSQFDQLRKKSEVSRIKNFATINKMFEQIQGEEPNKKVTQDNPKTYYVKRSSLLHLAQNPARISSFQPILKKPSVSTTVSSVLNKINYNTKIQGKNNSGYLRFS